MRRWIWLNPFKRQCKKCGYTECVYGVWAQHGSTNGCNATLFRFELATIMMALYQELFEWKNFKLIKKMNETLPVTLLEENTAFEKVFPFTAKHHIIFDVDVVKWDDIYPFLSALRFAYNLDISATKIKIAEFEVEIEKLKYENQNLKESKKNIIWETQVIIDDLNDQIKKLNEFIEEQKLYIKFKI